MLFITHSLLVSTHQNGQKNQDRQSSDAVQRKEQYIQMEQNYDELFSKQGNISIVESSSIRENDKTSLAQQSKSHNPNNYQPSISYNQTQPIINQIQQQKLIDINQLNKLLANIISQTDDIQSNYYLWHIICAVQQCQEYQNNNQYIGYNAIQQQNNPFNLLSHSWKDEYMSQYSLGINFRNIYSQKQFEVVSLFTTNVDVLAITLEFQSLTNFWFKDISAENWLSILDQMQYRCVYVQARENTLVMPFIALQNTTKKMYKSKILILSQTPGFIDTKNDTKEQPQNNLSITLALQGIVKFATDINQNKSPEKHDRFDVIAVIKYKVNEIDQLPIRSLCIWHYYKINMEFTMNQPSFLISLSIENVKILNIKDCINIENFYSVTNTYQSEDIQNLKKLKRYYSSNDTYENNNNSLLDVLLQNQNPLEYIEIYKGRNILPIMQIIRLKHLEKLRYVYLQYNCEGKMCTIDFLDNPDYKNLEVLVVKNGNLNYSYLNGGQHNLKSYNTFLQQLIQNKIEQLLGSEKYEQYKTQLNKKQSQGQSQNSIIEQSESVSFKEQHHDSVYSQQQDNEQYRDLFECLNINIQNPNDYFLYLIGQMYFLVNKETQYMILDFLHQATQKQYIIQDLKLSQYDDINKFVSNALDNPGEIYSYEQFQSQLKFAAYTRYSQFYFYQNDNFNLAKMNDTDWNLLFQNCNKRIMYIYAEKNEFIFNFVLMRSSLNLIEYIEGKDIKDTCFQDFAKKNEEVNYLNVEITYDIVIVTTRPQLTGFLEMKIRSLSYFFDGLKQQELNFKYPTYLQSAFFRNTIIKDKVNENNQFTNLKLMGSNFCDICNSIIQNLSVYYSINDNSKINKKLIQSYKQKDKQLSQYDYIYIQQDDNSIDRYTLPSDYYSLNSINPQYNVDYQYKSEKPQGISIENINNSLPPDLSQYYVYQSDKTRKSNDDQINQLFFPQP